MSAVARAAVAAARFSPRVIPIRPRILIDDELVIDSFAGGGGTSEGIEQAGLPVHIALNHSRPALAMHRINHPHTLHYCQNIRLIDPRRVCRGRRVGVFWLSPDCTYHSRARGGQPFRDRNKARRIRGLAWVGVEWADIVRPRLILLENVAEFTDWGPLLEDGTLCPMRKGVTFRRFVKRLQNLGYVVDWQELQACDYGAPTNRTRVFLIARYDGNPIVWPEQTHGPGLLPYVTAADSIDWSLPCGSIFERDRALVDTTLRRIACGVGRYALESPQPFIVTLRGTSTAHINSSASSIHEPLRTLSAQGTHHALVIPTLRTDATSELWEPTPARGRGYSSANAKEVDDFLTRYGDSAGRGTQDHLRRLWATQKLGGRDHREDVRAFLIKYYGTDQAPELREPLHTVTTHDRFAVVTVHGRGPQIWDIRMRMLTPRELFTAQGFPQDYVIDYGDLGESSEESRWLEFTRTQQVHLCGNSVCPPLARALVQANYNANWQSVPKHANGRLF